MKQKSVKNLQLINKTFYIGNRWRSSLWKLLWRELLVYTFSFLIISGIYRTCLHPDQQIIVEKLIRWRDSVRVV